MEISPKLNENKWLSISLIWLILGALFIFFNPFKIGMTLHYLSVAWEMYKNHIYLSTYSSGRIDFEKTPLLYWLIVGGWRIFGVNDFWPFILNYLIGWVILMLTAWLGMQLFQSARIAWLAVLVLISGFYWALFFQSIHFEILITLFGMLFLNWVVKATISQKNIYWFMAAMAFGLATFSKGLVSFIYYLPLVVFFPLFLEVKNLKAWYIKLILCMLSGLLIPLLWIISIYLYQGGSAVHYLLFGQVTQRVGVANSHKWWMALARVLTSFLPWVLLYGIYVAKSHEKIAKPIIVLWIVILIQVLFFGIFVELQALRYLAPLYPIIALLLVVGLEDLMSNKLFWGVASLTLCTVVVYQIYKVQTIPAQPMSVIAQRLKALENKGIPFAQFGYRPGNGNFEFLGRLNDDIPVLVDKSVQDKWLTDNPTGWVIKAFAKLPDQCQFAQQWKVDQWFVTLSTAEDFNKCFS